MKMFKCLLILPALSIAACSIKSDYQYDTTGYQAIEGASLSLENVHHVEVNWLNGNLYCSQSQSESLAIVESESEYPMYYKIKDDKLTIQFAKSGLSSRVIDNLNKDLTLALPASLTSLSVNLAKVKAEMTGKIAISKGQFNLADGQCSFETYDADESDFNLVNTNLEIKRVDVNYQSNEPQKHEMDINVVNASIKFGIDSEIGYKLDWKQVNSRFICEYGDNNYEVGNKLINLDIDAVNTDFKITKIVTK